MRNDIYKSGGIIIRDKKLLVSREAHKEYFIAPGGKLEKGETPKEALIRELNEELGIDVKANDLKFFGHFDAPASGQEERTVHMTVYLVKKFGGKMKVGHKGDELLWLNSKIPKSLKVGSIFEHEVIPRLKKKGLIG
jgi:8-oxo-dGTP diphosphatase